MTKTDSKDWKLSGVSQGGLGGTSQSLTTGLNYDGDGNVVIPDIVIPKGESIVQSEQDGAFRRTIFSNGAVETIQTLPANGGDGKIVTPVPLPGESQDVTGTGQDAAYQPKTAPGAKTDKAAKS